MNFSGMSRMEFSDFYFDHFLKIVLMQLEEFFPSEIPTEYLGILESYEKMYSEMSAAELTTKDGSLKFRLAEFKDGQTPDELLATIQVDGFIIPEYGTAIENLNYLLEDVNFRDELLKRAINGKGFQWSAGRSKDELLKLQNGEIPFKPGEVRLVLEENYSLETPVGRKDGMKFEPSQIIKEQHFSNRVSKIFPMIDKNNAEAFAKTFLVRTGVVLARDAFAAVDLNEIHKFLKEEIRYKP
ncbi:MAG: hypothetical protein WCH62_08625 [Candidatus Omnitrophota bacterium]